MKFLKKLVLTLSFPIWLPFVSFQYGWGKVIQSFRHLQMIRRGSNDEYKFYRSLARCSTIALFIMAGSEGHLIGAALGTLICPGVGTGIGAVLGSLIGVCLGMGLGAVLSKQLARGLSYRNSKKSTAAVKPINLTNPEKYRPNPWRRVYSEDRVAERYTKGEGAEQFSRGEIQFLLNEIYTVKKAKKKQLSLEARISPWFASREDKIILNQNIIYSWAIHKARNADMKKENQNGEIIYKITCDKQPNGLFFSIKPGVASDLNTRMKIVMTHQGAQKCR